MIIIRAIDTAHHYTTCRQLTLKCTVNLHDPAHIIFRALHVHVNIAKEVLQIHYSDLLVDIAHPYSLVSDLLQKKMIDCSIGNAMLSNDFTRREKMLILVDAIIEAVESKPAEFHTLVGVLGDKPFHRPLARLLRQSYGT